MVPVLYGRATKQASAVCAFMTHRHRHVYRAFVFCQSKSCFVNTKCCHISQALCCVVLIIWSCMQPCQVTKFDNHKATSHEAISAAEETTKTRIQSWLPPQESKKQATEIHPQICPKHLPFSWNLNCTEVREYPTMSSSDTFFPYCGKHLENCQPCWEITQKSDHGGFILVGFSISCPELRSSKFVLAPWSNYAILSAYVETPGCTHSTTTKQQQLTRQEAWL